MVKPLSQMPSDLKKRVTAIDKAIQKSVDDTEKAAGLAAKDAQQDEMRQDAGGNLHLSRVRKGKGAKIGARFDRVSGEVRVRATGPVPLIANDVRPHQIPKAGKATLLAIPGIGVRRSVDHPGTKGKDTWHRGREKAAPKVDRIVGKRTDVVVIKAFKAGG